MVFSPDFWELLASIEPLMIVQFVIWFLIGICPFIGAAIWIKKRIKVGAVSFAEFTLAYILILVLLYVLLWWLIGSEFATRFFSIMLGFIVGVPLMVLIFNHISEGIRKTFIVEFELDKRNINISKCYTYAHGGQIRVIILNDDGQEGFFKLLRRIFGKHKYLLYQGANFDFTEHKINLAYLCTEWSRLQEYLIVDGKKQYCDIINVKPIPATEFSELQFLINYKKWMDLQTRYAEEYMQRMEIEKDIMNLAIQIFRKWAAKVDEGRWSDKSLSITNTLLKYQEEKEKVVKKAKEAVTSPEFLAEAEATPEMSEEPA